MVYEDPLDGRSGWNWALEDNTAVFSIAGQQLTAVIKHSLAGPRFRLSPSIRIGDQQVRVTTRTYLCYELDEYGLMFRGRVETSHSYSGYVLKLNCGGSARVERWQRLQADVLVDWAASPAIAPGAPAENMLVVWMAKDQFHVYLNEKYLFSFRDATYAEGLYGIYVRDRTNGGLSVGFADLIARTVRLP